MTRELYAKQFYPLAQKAGNVFGINSVVILAQAILESTYGTSYSAKVRHNHFGITAYGSRTPYWDGAYSASKKNPNLNFRIYKSDQDSFYDFARLITSKYKEAAAVSNDTAAYAKAIAYSPYISEKNGDNRPQYQRAITVNASYISSLFALSKSKLVAAPVIASLKKSIDTTGIILVSASILTYLILKK
jgi:flagellar protein FlgJ